MTAFSVTRADVFPEGTEVSLYSANDWPYGPPTGEPQGTEITSAEVTDGVAEFDVDDGDYFAYAKVGSEDRYIRVWVREISEGGGGSLPAIEGWHAVGEADEPDFDSDAANFAPEGDAIAPVRFLKDQLGFVHLEGVATMPTEGGLIFYLPAGYRPEYVQYKGFAETDVQVYSNGAVSFEGGSPGDPSVVNYDFFAAVA